MKKYAGELALLVTAVIWGSGFVASAVSLEHYTAYQILAGRFLIGAVLLGVIFSKRWKFISSNTLIKGMVLGIFLYAAFALQTVGLQFTTPSKNAFLTAVNVVIVPFLGFLVYRKKVDLFELSGAVIALFGIGLLSLQWNSTMNFGDILTLFCAVCFAFHIFYTAQFVKTEDPITLTMIQMGTAAVIGIGVVGFRGETNLSMETQALIPLIYLALFSTTLAFLLQTMAQKYISETKAAIILSTESLWGMIFSVLLLQELITGRILAGAILILFAILLSETKLRFLNKKPLSKSLYNSK